MSNVSQTPSLQPGLQSHLPIDAETCPSCGQEIPSDKFEEISGRIAAREREQTFAITSQLETRYALERRQADAKAKADLESERQQAAADEANLLTELAKLRRDNAIALEAMTTEAKERESEIRSEAERAAELRAAERIAIMETSHKESETALQTRIDEAAAYRIAAKQKETALTIELQELRRASDAEMARLKESAAAEATRVRQVAIEEAETRFCDSLAAQEKAVAEANAKTREAEENLTTQREVLEKAKEDAVNAEKARAFEDSQRLANKVNDLQRALEKKTADELGEGAEIDIFEALKAEFQEDKIARIAKGAPGADIRHVVILRGQECGTILYDSKNHKQWRNEHVDKLKKDQLAARAEHAILSTHKFPQGKHQIHTQDGVLLANPARVVSIAIIIRQHLLQLHTLHLSEIERESKTVALYEFITSEHCALLLDRIDQRAGDLLAQQVKEIKWHENNWKRQGEALRAIQKARVDLENEISSILGTATDDSSMSEAS